MRTVDHVFKGTGGQIDLLNTLYGGSSLTEMKVKREDDRLVIRLSAPGVSANSFNVLVEGNKLVLYTLLVHDSESAGQRLAVPMFLKVIDIPDFIDAEHIEAEHEYGRVTVNLPFNDEEHEYRNIDIKNLF
ncbi:Hsp20/alpha crystallin family protein [Fibrella forsythiae]|uniref:Hsp20/alpha crystallin family protein n=1 Tax=Fibrella forsythiae TaxID=2817061 RepID=A0ABS3JJ10_9BACT|nr:Hsp20/alpha crystallin family protein [Fibrella forsythiae]MBO0949995.1 Hsp20/alpha crystallin family protein [Fibrella forsythiae]